MRAVIQRVSSSNVIADGVPTGKIGEGLMILLGVLKGDEENDAELLAAKIAKLRIFSDENGKMNKSVQDIGGSALVVSNFTLGANYAHGNRPDFLASEAPQRANELYEYFVSLLRKEIGTVETGVFGAHMDLTIQANGPVTIIMESDVLKRKGK
jgi:D-tyrosyl-tRNA(Tyr) deacylase